MGPRTTLGRDLPRTIVVPSQSSAPVVTIHAHSVPMGRPSAGESICRQRRMVSSRPSAAGSIRHAESVRAEWSAGARGLMGTNLRGTSSPLAVPPTVAPFVETAQWSVGREGGAEPQRRRATTVSWLWKLAALKRAASVKMALSVAGVRSATIGQCRRRKGDSLTSAWANTMSALYAMTVPPYAGATRVPLTTMARRLHLKAKSSRPSAVAYTTRAR